MRKNPGIWSWLQQMFDDARAEGVYPIVREGYRTHKQQTEVYDDKVAAYMKEGYIRVIAEKLAGQWVAVPGSSEHELWKNDPVQKNKGKCP